MSTKGAARKITRYQPCAEPDCPVEVGPRHPSTAFLYLHCETHRYNHSETLRDGLPSSPRWARQMCENCGAVYEKYATLVNKSTIGRHFCVIECRNAMGSKPRRGEIRTCALEECEETFYVRKSSTQRYHNRQCRDVANRSRVYLTFTCKECGEQFQVAESQARWNKNEFCTTEHARRYSKYKVGDKKLSGDGYVMVYAPDHCMAQPSSGWAFEHRMVVSDLLGRPLKPTEEVHHRSGNRQINTPDQLVLLSKSHPAGAGLRDKIEWCRAFIAENESAAEAVEAAGVITTLDTTSTVVALFDADGNQRSRPA